MENTSYSDLLHRESIISQVNNHFSDQVLLLKELVNYGTHLIPRCFVSSNRKLFDVIILPVLLKHSVSMLDSIEVQVSQGAILSASLQARSLFESTAYIKWLFLGDRIKKAKQYYVWELRNRKKFLKKLVTGYPEQKSFTNSLEKYEPELIEKLKNYHDNSEKQLSDIDKVLFSEEFSLINEQFENMKYPENAKWYQPNGPSSMKDLSVRLNIGIEYDTIYSLYSKIMHATVFSHQIQVEQNKIIFEPIRSLKDIDTLLFIVISLTIETYLLILEEYRPGELVNFKQKYKNEWRNRFLKIKHVKYDLDLHEI